MVKNRLFGNFFMNWWKNRSFHPTTVVLTQTCISCKHYGMDVGFLFEKNNALAFEWGISEHFLTVRTIFRRLWKMVKNRLFWNFFMGWWKNRKNRSFHPTTVVLTQTCSSCMHYGTDVGFLFEKYYVSAFEWGISEHFLTFRTIFRRLWKMVKNRLFPLFACSSTGGWVADLGHFLAQKWPKMPSQKHHFLSFFAATGTISSRAGPWGSDQNVMIST